MKLRPTLRYFGGKFRLASWIISHFPQHKVYVEPFCGAASVLMKKERAYAEIINDLDDSIYTLFKILSDPIQSAELQRQIENTPYSRREFELAKVYHPDPLEKTRRLIVRSFMGFGSDSALIEKKVGFRANSNASGSSPAHDWVNWPEYIPAFHSRLKGVVIECRSAMDVMKDHDGPDTLHYVDPPYLMETRNNGGYNFEMTMQDHVDLLTFLKTLKGKVVLSGYDSPLYDSLGWRKEKKSHFTNGDQKKTEVLWLNFDIDW